MQDKIAGLLRNLEAYSGATDELLRCTHLYHADDLSKQLVEDYPTFGRVREIRAQVNGLMDGRGSVAPTINQCKLLLAEVKGQ